MILFEWLLGIVSSKIAYESSKPTPFEKSSKHLAHKYDLLKKYAKMDLWDGIEKQVIEQLKLYSSVEFKWYKCCAYWKGDINKSIIVNLIDIEINRKFLNSNLSMDEFAINYFIDLHNNHSENDCFWRSEINESYRHIHLYDEASKLYSYSSFVWSDKLHIRCNNSEIKVIDWKKKK